MKLVCINNGPMDGATDSFVNLTIGKVYKTLGDDVGSNDSGFKIVNDIGDEVFYYFARFETLELNRDKKLEKLGI